ncbi:excinuclease ABC subunit UvrB [Candidatus Mycoplasma mahonii]|uniref:excinuclease ABC subunit UvrB n=1 Tax=Candidatus Mycoplasma mahonii TaxID=3004105 RepID=UPI0035716DBD
MNFKLNSGFSPKGDQPKAIEELIKGINNKDTHQVLLGATATGKTFTIANVIQNQNRPVIVLSHNKTLAAQLYSELKSFFPENRVEYFISNFDYYRPEAYMPSSDTFIDKTSKSNWDLESMRMSSLNALSTRRDTIVVASVAAIYGALSPDEYRASFYPIEVGMKIDRKDFFAELVKRNYSRNNVTLEPGNFRARGDVIELAPGWTSEYYIKIDMFGDVIEQIMRVDVLTGEVLRKHQDMTIFPANAYTTKKETIDRVVVDIEKELIPRLAYFKENGKLLEAQRLEERTNSDLESLKEFGVTSGIENYSRHLDGRKVGERPYTILDYMPNDALMILDESHMMIPQLHAMYKGDFSRKSNLVNYGFRLPSALDNRPLKFEEFESDFSFQKIYISATPSAYEVDKADGVVVSQIIRPTGLLDPTIEVVPIKGQVEDIYDRLQKQKKKKQRTFIMTTTKRTAEELTRFLQEKNEKVMYMHSEHKTFEREEILRKLRKGIYDTVIGINLLREGIDIPEVSLILILDADKESFMRGKTSLIQMIGRAARNKDGHVIFYGDVITKSMKGAMDETQRRRDIQEKSNIKHTIIPQTIVKPIPKSIDADSKRGSLKEFMNGEKLNKESKKAFIDDLRTQMLKASKDMDYERAAHLRDLILELESDIL